MHWKDLCHKEPAMGVFVYLERVLYGIREQLLGCVLDMEWTRLVQPTSVVAPVSAPGQWKVTNSWHRLWRTKLHTGNINNLEKGKGAPQKHFLFPTLALISLLSESPEIKELKMIFTSTNQLAKIVSRILTKWSPCSDSRMLDVWKIWGWTGDFSPQRFSSSSQLPSEPGPWLRATRSPANNFLFFIYSANLLPLTWPRAILAPMI